MTRIFSALAALTYALAVPFTWAVSIVDTWNSSWNVPMKIILSLSWDAFVGAVWPMAWTAWLLLHWAGVSTPMRAIAGF